jgi:hypothetical protein
MHRPVPGHFSKKLLLAILGICQGNVDFIQQSLLQTSYIYFFFRFDIQGTTKRKLRTDIHYPLTNLDLTPYICPIFRKHPKYNLCAVVVSKMARLPRVMQF